MSGYEVLCGKGLIGVVANTWALTGSVQDLPVEATLKIVGDVGYLPTSSVKVEAGAANQYITPEAAENLGDWMPPFHEGMPMKEIPVIFKGRWQLYQAENGDIVGFDIGLLEMIDFKTYGPAARLFSCGMLGGWMWSGNRLYIAPGRFSAEDYEKILHLQKIDWRRQQKTEDPSENMSIFDQERVPMEPEPQSVINEPVLPVDPVTGAEICDDYQEEASDIDSTEDPELDAGAAEEALPEVPDPVEVPEPPADDQAGDSEECPPVPPPDGDPVGEHQSGAQPARRGRKPRGGEPKKQ